MKAQHNGKLLWDAVSFYFNDCFLMGWFSSTDGGIRARNCLGPYQIQVVFFHLVKTLKEPCKQSKLSGLFKNSQLHARLVFICINVFSMFIDLSGFSEDSYRNCKVFKNMFTNVCLQKQSWWKTSWQVLSLSLFPWRSANTFLSFHWFFKTWEQTWEFVIILNL